MGVGVIVEQAEHWAQGYHRQEHASSKCVSNEKQEHDLKLLLQIRLFVSIVID
jgi:hypothetical protein